MHEGTNLTVASESTESLKFCGDFEKTFVQNYSLGMVVPKETLTYDKSRKRSEITVMTT